MIKSVIFILFYMRRLSFHLYLFGLFGQVICTRHPLSFCMSNISYPLFVCVWIPRANIHREKTTRICLRFFEIHVTLLPFVTHLKKQTYQQLYVCTSSKTFDSSFILCLSTYMYICCVFCCVLHSNIVTYFVCGWYAKCSSERKHYSWINIHVRARNRRVRKASLAICIYEFIAYNLDVYGVVLFVCVRLCACVYSLRNRQRYVDIG